MTPTSSNVLIHLLQLILFCCCSFSFSVVVFVEAIVGGTIVNDTTEFPAFVWSGISPQDGWGCGGALIAPDIVLSAAHCLPSFVGNDNNYVGALNISGADAVEALATERILVHPQFDWSTKVNDLLLIKLKGSAGRKVTPFDLNTDPDYPPTNASVTVIGFGTTSEYGGQGSFSPHLKKVNVDVYSYQACTAIYEGQMMTLINDSQHLCAGTPVGGRDGCESDSGTPLLARTTSTKGTSGSSSNNKQHRHKYGKKENSHLFSKWKYLIVGITVDGIGCGRPNMPAYYVRISSQVSWIQDGVCVLSENPPHDWDCKKRFNNNNNTAEIMKIWNQTLTNPPTIRPTLAPTTYTPTTLGPTTATPTASAPTPKPTPLHPIIIGPHSRTSTTGKQHHHHHTTLKRRAFRYMLLMVALIAGFWLGRFINRVCCLSGESSRRRREQYEPIPSHQHKPAEPPQQMTK